MTSRAKSLVLVLVAVLLGGAVGRWAYQTHQKTRLRAAVSAMLQDAGPRMREALKLEAGLPADGRMGLGSQLDQHAAAVEQRLRDLRKLDGAADQALVDATDSYLLTVREILREQAASNHSREALAQSLDALRRQMRADDRAGGWVKEAVVARERVDQDFRDYRMATEAFEVVLGTLPAAQTKIAAFTDAAQLSDVDLVAEARNRTIEALKQARTQTEQATQLASYR